MARACPQDVSHRGSGAADRRSPSQKSGYCGGLLALCGSSHQALADSAATLWIKKTQNVGQGGEQECLSLFKMVYDLRLSCEMQDSELFLQRETGCCDESSHAAYVQALHHCGQDCMSTVLFGKRVPLSGHAMTDLIPMH